MSRRVHIRLCIHPSKYGILLIHGEVYRQIVAWRRASAKVIPPHNVKWQAQQLVGAPVCLLAFRGAVRCRLTLVAKACLCTAYRTRARDATRRHKNCTKRKWKTKKKTDVKRTGDQLGKSAAKSAEGSFRDECGGMEEGRLDSSSRRGRLLKAHRQPRLTKSPTPRRSSPLRSGRAHRTGFGGWGGKQPGKGG